VQVGVEPDGLPISDIDNRIRTFYQVPSAIIFWPGHKNALF
jgi:hypothetical protein